MYQLGIDNGALPTGMSDMVIALRRQIADFSRTALPVLVSGETGSGKEIVAKELHRLSERTGRFVPIDCAALSEGLIESELFGHLKGSFTGAHADRQGLAAYANGGTFFLDEVAELPLSAQTRLLRLIDQGTFRPIGSNADIKVDLRIIAATWVDLNERVATGRFRADLAHRLMVLHVDVPPLRERREDINTLIDTFLAQERKPIRFTSALRSMLMEWPWPGNVRELKNSVSYICAVSQGPEAGLESLPARLRGAAPTIQEREFVEVKPAVHLPYMEARRIWLDSFQRRYVETLLQSHKGNISAAAVAGQMDRRSIQRIIKKINREKK